MAAPSRTHHKALMAIVWRMQDEHRMTFDEVLRAVDGDPNDVLVEMDASGLPMSRAELRRWIRANEANGRKSA